MKVYGVAYVLQVMQGKHIVLEILKVYPEVRDHNLYITAVTVLEPLCCICLYCVGLVCVNSSWVSDLQRYLQVD